MKSKKSKILSLILVVTMCFAMCSQVALAEETNIDASNNETISTVKEDGVAYYGRSALASLDNATALLYAYDQLAAGVENAEEKISVYNGTNAISIDEIKVVMEAYTRDYAQHFWMGTSYGTSSYPSKNTVAFISPSYLYTGDELAEARATFEAAVESILSGIKPSMSEYEKELYLHDALAKSIVYSESANAHNAYGALVEGVSVCEGYAESFQYLLRCVGIQSFIAEGSSINPSTNEPEAHAWNYVRINGNYYHVDLTWDDQGKEIYHAYFNQPDAVMLEDHAITAAAYALPTCGSDDANYFKGKDSNLETYDVSSVAKLLKDNHLKVHVYVPGDMNEFLTWFTDHILDIATENGINASFRYSYVLLGKEAILNIDIVCDHESLTFVPEKKATCTENGNIAYYTCECEKWFEDADATTLIEDYDSVVVEATGHDYVNGICSVCDDVMAIESGWMLRGGKWYYFKAYEKQTGWQRIDGAWYYFNDAGTMQTGWQYIGGTWYYMNSSGAMQTGWQYIGGTWYYFHSGGAMATGNVIIDGAFNKFTSSGAWLGYASGWQNMNGKWYYTNASGKVSVGWKSVGGTYYYFNASGVMQTGWLKDGNVWYYLNNSGAMVTGWQYIGGTWYYFHSSGAMATGTVIIGGTTYRFNASGAWIR